VNLGVKQPRIVPVTGPGDASPFRRDGIDLFCGAYAYLRREPDAFRRVLVGDAWRVYFFGDWTRPGRL